MCRLVALLSFYDEPIEDLTACIVGCRTAGVDHVIAFDGAYALFPGGQAASDPRQHAAITLACRELGIGCTLHVPASTWAGNEVQKRTALFKAAEAVTEPGDWLLVVDADEAATRAPADLKTQLDSTPYDVAEVQILDVVALREARPDWPAYFSMRRLFRAQPITVQTNHITYVSASGTVLQGWDGRGDLAPSLDLSGSFLLEHRPDRRPQDRQLAKFVYYGERDDQRIERGQCECGEPAVRLVAHRWKSSPIGPVSEWHEACATCAAEFESVGRRRLLQMGVDPDRVRIENRNGHAPIPA